MSTHDQTHHLRLVRDALPITYFSFPMSLGLPVLHSVRLFQVAGIAAGSQYESDSRIVIQRRALH